MNLLQDYKNRSRIDHDADPQKISLDMDGEIVCGVFVNEDRPTFWENVQQGISRKVKKQKPYRNHDKTQY